MSTIIVGIHGLANKSEKPKLKEWWEESLREGLRVTLEKPDADFRFNMVYWADLLYKNPLHEDASFSFDQLYNDEPYVAAKAGELKEYKEGWSSELLKWVGSAQGSLIDAAHEYFGTDAIAKLVLDRVLKDLAFYYDNNRQIEGRDGQKGLARDVRMNELRDTLLNLDREAGDQVVLIAHSMGTIIAYDVLRAIGREDKGFVIDHFITIGSPLGLPTVKANIYETNKSRENDIPVRTPTVVRQSWINYADRADPVCLDNHLRDDYGKNADKIRVVDDIVLNGYVSPSGKANHHKSFGYLRTPELSRFLAPLV